jgi:hypothetical protein
MVTSVWGVVGKFGNIEFFRVDDHMWDPDLLGVACCFLEFSLGIG